MLNYKGFQWNLLERLSKFQKQSIVILMGIAKENEMIFHNLSGVDVVNSLIYLHREKSNFRCYRYTRFAYSLSFDTMKRLTSRTWTGQNV